MSRLTGIAPLKIPRETARWAGCFGLAVFFHGAVAFGALLKWTDHADAIATGPVIMVDLAPVAMSPQIEEELPPGPVQNRSEPEPEPEPPKVETVELPPDPAPKPEVAVAPPKPPEKPKEKKQKKRNDLASAPTRLLNRADQAAAPMAGATARDSNAIPTWKSMLVAQLERYKRYPSEAQSRGEYGVAQLAFTVDRGGGVHNVRVVRSSGSSALDQATVDLAYRASPLPAPPPEIGGGSIPVVVPIRYNMR